MNHHQQHHIRLQSLAEQQERSGSTERIDPEIDAYRFVHRLMRTAPIPNPPADLAASVTRRISDREEFPRAESWCIAIALICAAAVAAVFALPVLGDALNTLRNQLPRAPWRMLLAAGSGLLAVWGMDVVRSARALRG